MDEYKERWMPIPGYEGLYEVSDLGRVRSLGRVVPRSDGRQRVAPGRLRRLTAVGADGRRSVVLSRDAVQTTRLIAPLVLAAFVGPRPQGAECCHNDGDAANDRLSNLRWDTSSANSYDVVRHGQHHSAEKTTCPRGHALESPNLVKGRLPNRICKACTWARASRQRAQKRGELYNLASGSNEHYERIMSMSSSKLSETPPS